MTDRMDPMEALARRASEGDEAALEQIFERCRSRLHVAIERRLDPRLAARLDVSDVLQETWIEALRRIRGPGLDGDFPVFLQLREIARERVIDAHRRHLGADRRSIDREVPLLPADSSAHVVRGVLGPGTTPSQAAASSELGRLLRAALAEIGPEGREIIFWRHLERLSHAESAALLGINEDAARKRYLRSLRRLRDALLKLGVTSGGST